MFTYLAGDNLIKEFFYIHCREEDTNKSSYLLLHLLPYII